MARFNMKAAAAAVAIAAAAIAGAANATIDTTATGGEMILTVWDPVTLQTYVRDLGITIAQWNATGFSSVAHTSADQTTFGAGGGAADTNWTTFFKTADQSQLVWDVTAETNGRGGLALVTSNSGLATVSSTPQSGVTSSYALWSSFANAVNVLPTGTPNFNTMGTQTTVNGSAICADQTASCSYTNATTGHGGNNFGGNVPFTLGAGVGQSLAFYQITTAASPLTTQYAGTFSLGADGNLSYAVAAVPEPGTWAMFAAGLLAVGSIARRRIS